MNSEKIKFKTSKPLWFLGIGFHGPYTEENQTLHRLIVDLTISKQNQALAKRRKICRVKIPNVVLPMFLDLPVQLEQDLDYIITTDYEFDQQDQNQNWPAYGAQYEKAAILKEPFSTLTFTDERCGLKNSCTVAYVQCGQVRFLHFWPVEPF